MPGAGGSRYAKVRHARDLASLSVVQLGLAGEVGAYRMGPDMFPADSDGDTVILTLSEPEVFRGPASGRDAQVLIRDYTVTELEEFLPLGSPVVLYVSRTEQDFGERHAGTYYFPVSPQGFITGSAETSVFPYDPALNSGDSLATQVPEGVQFPL